VVCPIPRLTWYHAREPDFMVGVGGDRALRRAARGGAGRPGTHSDPAGERRRRVAGTGEQDRGNTGEDTGEARGNFGPRPGSAWEGASGTRPGLCPEVRAYPGGVTDSPPRDPTTAGSSAASSSAGPVPRAALAAVPVILLHLLPRRWRLLRPRLGGPRVSRRTLLAAAGVAALGAVAWGAANVLDAVQGGIRRFTGSRWLPEGGIPPPTTFYGEGIPSLDAAAWRLRVTGRVTKPLMLDLRTLADLGVADTEDAVLDCTSGWAIETGWRGVPLTAVLDATAPAPAVAGRRVLVRSVTGWSAELPMDEARGAFLATGVGGLDLPAGNGAPCRLVVPDRRGLDWVKWVTEIRVA